MTGRYRGLFWPLLLLLLLPLLLPAPPVRAADLPGPAKAAVEAAIQREMKAQGIPGLSAALVTDDQLTWSGGYGQADIENAVPATAATVYRLGSISKPITAVGVLQLAEQGKLDLDAPIQTYVPAFPQKPYPVTSRQLLSHLGGVRHYGGSPGEFGSTRHYKDLTETLHIFASDPLLHEPGTKYLYTTYGYSLLGCALERASGRSYADYLRERVWRPAGMNTMRVDDVYAIIPRRAQGYRKTAAGTLENSALADTSNKIPGGGLCSSVEDLARFAIAVRTGRLLKSETVERMWTRQRTKDGKETGYGLGWALSTRDGLREVHHGGAQQRVRTHLYLLPEQRVAVALMCNLEGAELTPLARRIADILVKPPGK